MAKSTIHIALEAKQRARIYFIATAKPCSLAEAVRLCIDEAAEKIMSTLNAEASATTPRKRARGRVKREDVAAA